MVARVLKVARRSEPRDLDLEVAPLERIAADLLQITISPVSKLHGVEVGELRLPRGVVGVDGDPRRARRWCPSAVRSCATATTCSSSPHASSGSGPSSGCAQVSERGRLAQWLDE